MVSSVILSAKRSSIFIFFLFVEYAFRFFGSFAFYQKPYIHITYSHYYGFTLHGNCHICILVPSESLTSYGNNEISVDTYIFCLTAFFVQTPFIKIVKLCVFKVRIHLSPSHLRLQNNLGEQKIKYLCSDFISSEKRNRSSVSDGTGALQGSSFSTDNLAVYPAPFIEMESGKI